MRWQDAAWGGLFVVACGCGSAQKKSAAIPPPPPEDASLNDVDPDWQPEEVGGGGAAKKHEAESTHAEDKNAKPEFKEGMSVDEAIAAVPRHYDFIGIDQENLAKPLQDPETFAACKPGTQHFSIRVAVWDGKPVGVDVDAKNKKLKECLSDKVWHLEWKERVDSINTVEYSL